MIDVLFAGVVDEWPHSLISNYRAINHFNYHLCEDVAFISLFQPLVLENYCSLQSGGQTAGTNFFSFALDQSILTTKLCDSLDLGANPELIVTSA